MSDNDSIILLQRFQDSGDDAAARELFAAYFFRLEQYASRRMSGALQQRVGADDLAQSVFISVFGHLREKDSKIVINQSGDLWKTLMNRVMTRVKRSVEKSRAGKRDLRRETAIKDGQMVEIASSPSRSDIDDAAAKAIEPLLRYIISDGDEEWPKDCSGRSVTEIWSVINSSPEIGAFISQSSDSQTQSQFESSTDVPIHSDRHIEPIDLAGLSQRVMIKRRPLRRLLYLRLFVENFTQEEIAKVLAVGISTVARDKEWIEKACDESPPA
jgi:DNA-directed RNA polymerase specialized sigma24 family protein